MRIALVLCIQKYIHQKSCSEKVLWYSLKWCIEAQIFCTGLQSANTLNNYCILLHKFQPASSECKCTWEIEGFVDFSWRSRSSRMELTAYQSFVQESNRCQLNSVFPNHSVCFSLNFIWWNFIAQSITTIASKVVKFCKRSCFTFSWLHDLSMCAFQSRLLCFAFTKL